MKTDACYFWREFKWDVAWSEVRYLATYPLMFRVSKYHRKIANWLSRTESPKRWYNQLLQILQLQMAFAGDWQWQFWQLLVIATGLTKQNNGPWEKSKSGRIKCHAILIKTIFLPVPPFPVSLFVMLFELLGPDWKWGNQDGGPGNIGRVFSVKGGVVEVNVVFEDSENRLYLDAA